MKKLMVKFIALALTLCCCFGVFAGCGGSTDNDGKLTLFYSDLSGVNTAIKRKSDLYNRCSETARKKRLPRFRWSATARKARTWENLRQILKRVKVCISCLTPVSAAKTT